MRNLNKLVVVAAMGMLALAARALPARGADRDAAPARPGRTAAHAALAEKAELPVDLPRLPPQAAVRPPRGAAAEKKGDATGRARAHAEARASDDARAAHV